MLPKGRLTGIVKDWRRRRRKRACRTGKRTHGMLGLILIHVSAYLVLLCACSLDGKRVM